MSRPSTSPTGWSTVSNGSSVQDEDELSVPFGGLALRSALLIPHCYPKTVGFVGQRHEDFGQVFSGSSATNVAVGPSLRDSRQATGSKAAPCTRSFGETCKNGEQISAAAPQVRYFGCPFSKHDPARYELVMNVCTHRPGWDELKRVLEHLHKVHSRKNRCERCHTQYPKQVNFDKHLSKNNCDIVKELSYPELMTPEQEEIFGRVFDVMPYENKWRAYYQFLFPNASDHHSVDPYYDYTTLTHRLDLCLPSQKRPALPSSEPEDSPQYKRQSRRMSATLSQAGSFITQISDTSPPSQAEDCPRSQSRKTPRARSFINQIVRSSYYPPPEPVQHVQRNISYQEIGTCGSTDIASQPDCLDYDYGSGDGEFLSVNQNQEIGSGKYVDDASPSINHDSAYGSRNETIPSSSNLHAPVMLPSIPHKVDSGDSAISLTSNASVLTGPTAKSGSAAQNVSNPMPPLKFYPPKLDPNLPSNMITPEEQSYLGFNSEILLDFNVYSSVDITKSQHEAPHETGRFCCGCEKFPASSTPIHLTRCPDHHGPNSA